MSSDSALYDLLWQCYTDALSARPSLLSAATSHLLSLPPTVAGQQLVYQSPSVELTSLMLLSLPAVNMYKEAAPLLTLMLKLGRENSSTTNQMDLRDGENWTPLHFFATNCSDLSLTKMVLLEHPPALLVRTNADTGRFSSLTPLQCAEHVDAYHDNPDVAVLLRAVTDAYNTTNYVAIESICGGSSPYLVREISKQANTLRASVAICLKRQEEAPSALVSRETRVVLSILGAFCPDLVRCVLEYAGPYAEIYDAGWMRRELFELRRDCKKCATVEELAAANKKQAATIETQAATIEAQAAAIGRLTE